MPKPLKHLPMYQSTSHTNPDQLALVSPITRGVWPILERVINESYRTLFVKQTVESVRRRNYIFLNEPTVLTVSLEKLMDHIVETLWNGPIMRINFHMIMPFQISVNRLHHLRSDKTS
jgi:hypothetical protein